MLRNYFLINLILAIIIGFLGFKLYNVSAYPLDIPSEPTIKHDQKVDVKDRRKEKTLNGVPFQIISKMDVFRPSRSAPVLEESKPEKAAPKNTPRLFGTIILDNNKTAILEDPDTRTTKSYRVNESVAGFVIADILENKVVFLRDGDKVEVRLRDDKGIKPTRRSTYKSPSKRRIQSRKPKSRPKRQPRTTRPRGNVKKRNTNPLDISPHGIE